MTRKLFCLIFFVLVLGTTGSADAGTEAFLEVGGVVVMEGENFHAADGRTDENNYEWRISNTQDGFVGSGYADTPGPQGTNGAWDNACEVTYEIDFSTSGTYSVWIRRYTIGGASNSCWVGLDGVGNGSNDNTGDANQWIWKSLGSIDVTAGLHTFNLRRRESAFKVDRIVLTTDGATPTGDGPPESLRGGLESASDPNPAPDANDVGRDGSLSWTPGEFANTHDVYFGTAFDDVNDASSANLMDVLVSAGQDANSFDPGRLHFGQTYYWRVDEVNGAPDFTVFKGETWGFTVESFALPITNITAAASSSFGDSGAEKTIDGSGLVDDLHGTSAGDMWISAGVPATLEYAFDKAYKLHELWIWNSNQLIEAFIGFGAKDVVIEHSLDGENWTVLEGVSALAQAPGLEGYAANNIIDFGGAVAQHVRMSINTVQGFAPQTSLSEVRFLYIPTFATGPNPASGATDVAPDVTLAWGRNGREADHHDVYVGSDSNSLSLAGSVSESSFDSLALDLQLGQSYAWRVNEVNEAMDPSTWQGTVWNFTTVDAIVIDDMESYKDEEFLEIWATWIDGFGDEANNGALVGANPGIGDFSPETDNFHGGGQSLPIHYDNTAAAQSEATRTFDAPMDWSIGGAETLVRCLSGASGNTGQFYLKVNGSKVVYDGDASAISTPFFTQWNIDLASVGANLQAVTTLTIGIEGGSGVLFIDDILLYKAAPAVPELIFLEAEAADVLGASWKVLDDPAASGGMYIGSVDGDGDDNDLAPGVEWHATYSFNAAGGTYKVVLRAQEQGSDGVWVRITTATAQTHEDPDQPGTGWVRFNGIDAPSGWAWDEVHSDDHGQAVVNWTLSAGPNTIEIAKREDGVGFDAIVITDDVN